MFSTLRHHVISAAALAPWREALSSHSCSRIVSWNARSLDCHDLELRKRKLAMVDKLVHSNDTILLQEVKSSLPRVRALFASLPHDCIVHSSLISDSTGGVVSIFAPKGAKGFQTDPVDIIIPGRAIRSVVRSPNITTVYYNIHNFSLTAGQIGTLSSKVADDLAHARRAPLNYIVILAGDLNLMSRDNVATPIQRAAAASTDDNMNEASSQMHGACSADCSSNVALLRPLLDQFQELEQHIPSHFNIRLRSLSCIDRILTSIPSWALLQTKISSGVINSPIAMYKRGLSDHAPVFTMLSCPRRIPKDRQPIPSSITKHRMFQHFLARRESGCDFTSLPPLARLDLHMRLIRKAAEDTRDFIFVAGNDDSRTDHLGEDRALADILLASSISRAVCRNDTSLARKLLHVSARAAELLVITGSSVHLLDSDAFTAWASAVCRRQLDSHSADLRGMARSSGKSGFNARSQLAALRRRSKVWAPFGRSIPLVGVLCDDDQVISNADDMEDALFDGWRGSFDVKHTDVAKQDEILQHLNGSIDVSEVPFPVFNRLVRLVQNLLDSGVGPDGLPYSAWKSTSCCETLFEVLLWLIQGRGASTVLVESLLVFVPKKITADELFGAIRSTSSTRPISLKNSCSKILASLLNDSVKWSLSRALHDSQRGFVIQRRFLNNVLDLDTEARLASRLPPRGGGFFVLVNRKWRRVAEVAVSGQDIALADVFGSWSASCRY